MVLSDYDNGSRIFSLLLTPSWMPKAPIAIGLCLLAAAMVAEIDKRSHHCATWQRMMPYALFVAVAVILFALGRKPPTLPGSHFDFGSVTILLAVIVGAFAANGPRVGLSVVAIAAGSIALFVGGKTLGSGFLAILLFVGIVFYMAIGVYVAFALAIVGLLSVYFLTPVPFPVTLADRAWSGVNSFSLTAVPLKVLMAAILVRSGLTNELFSIMARALAALPGGLAHAATAGCAIFAAVSGSSVATAATIGTVACPEMTRRGYSEKLTYGTVAAGGTLGILIPPSIAMIIYSTTVGVPATKLFIAGILPALLMTFLFMAVILCWALLYPSAAPALPKNETSSPHARQRDRFRSGDRADRHHHRIALCRHRDRDRNRRDRRHLRLSDLRPAWPPDPQYRDRVIHRGGVVTSFIFLIVVGANVISFGFDYLKISQKIMSAATETHADRGWSF